MTNLTNGLTYDEVVERVVALGEAAGKGDDSQVQFHMQIVEGAYHGALDLDKNKHGTGIDDATKMAEAYYNSRSKSSMFNPRAKNQRKLISTTRLDIRLGMWSKGGSGEPIGSMNNLITIRGKLQKNPALEKKLDDATNTLHKFARAQLRSDQLMSDAQLEAFCYRKVPDLRTPEEILEAVQKQLKSLRDGKAANGTAKDDSSLVRDAITKVTDRLKEISGERVKLAQATGSPPTP